MSKLIIIWLLSLFAVAALVLIPFSYQARRMNRPIRATFGYDGALADFAARYGARRGAIDVEWSGHWISIGSPQGKRLLLVVARGRAAAAIAVPRRASIPLGGLSVNRSFIGVQVSRTVPASFGLLLNAFAEEMTGQEVEQYNQWMASFNADTFSLSAPLTLLIGIFGVLPLYAFFAGPFRRYRRRRHGLCIKCGYNLTGSVTGTCPECGTKVGLPAMESPRRGEGS